MAIHRFDFPTEIHLGVGARSLLPDRLSAHGIRRPLLVTDEGVARLGFFDEVCTSTRNRSDLAVFAGVRGDPDLSQVAAGVEAFVDHAADGVIALGGGAALDAAKAVALMATHPGELLDYEVGNPSARTPTAASAPIVALPTTAGTGSEVGRSAVISDDDRIKHIVSGPPLLARAVLADPDLTVGLPVALTASTGFDALTHNVEAFLAPAYHPLCDGIALEGVRLVAEHLSRAVSAPEDRTARTGMLAAAMMGAVAFQKGLGVVHSCAHALGTVTGLHHGLANAIMIDVALRVNLEAVPERFARLAQATGSPNPTPEGFLAWLGDLKTTTGIPRSLLDVDVDPSMSAALVAVARDDACLRDNPRAVTEADLAAIFEQALT